jgi:hypothetical protein
MLGEIKRLIINQCGPVLMGVKPAALFPLRSRLCLDCLYALLPQHIELFVLRETCGRPLVLLYEKNMLAKALSHIPARNFLLDLGYPDTNSIIFILSCLKRRFCAVNFPHEIGLFLGYPLEDVTGFIRHKGQNYKFCGYWKVYGDVEKAKQLFRQYDLCREYMLRRSLSHTWKTRKYPALQLPSQKKYAH